MRSLSKDAEQRLIAAIEKAAALVNDGAEPNAAIIKSASEANIPAGHINLMVHAYNTGRTNKQREQGENTLEKAADFQLADADTVLAALYPATVKTSSELRRQDVVSAEYALSPAGMLARRKAAQEKTAAAQSALPAPTYVPLPRDEQFAAQREYSAKQAARREQEELRRQVTEAYQKSAAAMDELAEFFKRPGNMTFGDAVRQVELRFGAQGVSVLDKVATVYPHFKKQASTSARHWGENPLYGLVQNVLARVETYVMAKRAYDETTAAPAKPVKAEPLTGSVLPEDFSDGIRLKSALNKHKGPMHPAHSGSIPSGTARLFASMGLGPAVAPPPAPKKPAEKQKPAEPKAKKKDEPRPSRGPAGPRGPAGQPGKGQPSDAKGPLMWTAEQIGMAGGKKEPGELSAWGGGNALGLNDDPSKLHAKAYRDISTADHEAALKSIRAQAALHDMMLNDEVISGHDPAEVAVAFNEIADIAPAVVGSPAVLAAALRKRLEAGQLADFDVKQLLEMDKIKADRDNKLLETRNLELNMVDRI